MLGQDFVGHDFARPATSKQISQVEFQDLVDEWFLKLKQ